MATRSASSNKREFSKPHLTTSPMLIDVQGRVARIYERRDISERSKTLNFLANAFAVCWLLFAGLVIAACLLVGIVQFILHGMAMPAPVNITFSLSEFITGLFLLMVGLLKFLVALSPMLAGTLWMYNRREFWAPELAKRLSDITAALSGEFRTTLTDITDTTQRVFVGRFYRLRWNVTGDHSNTLQTIDVKPVFMNKKRLFNKKEKRRLAYWVATLKYSRIPKDGKTELTWI